MYKYKHGFVAPREFLKTYAEKVDTPALLHHGKANADFIEQVRESTLEGMTFEGVICKGGKDKRNNPIMFKVKSWAWLDRLKGYCGDDEQMYEKLR